MRQALLLNLEFAIWLDWLADEHPRAVCLFPIVLGLQVWFAMLGFYMDGGELNLGPNARPGSPLF